MLYLISTKKVSIYQNFVIINDTAMIIALSRKEKIIVEDLKSEIIKSSNRIISLIIGITTIVLEGIFRYISSLSEFSISNIWEKGLVNILTDRAMRFFKFSIQQEGRAISKKINGVQKKRANNLAHSVSTTREIRSSFKKRVQLIFKIGVFPLYLLILSGEILYQCIKGKNVKNKYST